VNYGPRSILLHLYYRLLSTSIIYFLQTNIFYHMIRLILCLQQTGEIDNLTASWGKVLWLCCVHVPRCCWCQGHTPDKAPYINSLEKSPKLVSINLEKWFLSPTGSIKPWFNTEGNLLLCSSYLPLRVHNWVASTANQVFLMIISFGCTSDNQQTPFVLP
jgi:hypothetical protein